MSELPKGWISTTIGEINVYRGSTINPGKYPDSFFELYSVPSFPSGHPEIVKGQEIGSTKQLLKPNDILLCKINPRINRVWQVKEKTNFPQIGSSEWIIIRQPEIVHSFLRQQLSSEKFRTRLCSEVSGVGGSLTRAQPKLVAGYEIVLAPYDEQVYIAEKVEKLLDSANTLKSRIEAIPALLTRCRQSVHQSAISGRLTKQWRQENQTRPAQIKDIPSTSSTRRNVPDEVSLPTSLSDLVIPENWQWASTASLLKKGLLLDVKDGNHGSNHPKSSEFSAEGLPFLTAANITEDGQVDFEAAPKLAGAPLKKLKVGFSLPGDVILTHKGTVGRVAVSRSNSVLSPQTTYYRVNPDYISNKYLAIYLRSPIFGRQLDSIKSQTTRDFAPITAQYKFFILLPPLNEQLEIAERAENALNLIGDLERKLVIADKLAASLSTSILENAFNGELSSEWREHKNTTGHTLSTGEDLLNKIKKSYSAVDKKVKAEEVMGSAPLEVATMTAKKIIPVIEALKKQNSQLSGQKLFELSGYPEDASPEIVERFFLDLRHQLSTNKISRVRDGDQDIFDLTK